MVCQFDRNRDAEAEQPVRRLVIVERNAFFRECLLRSLAHEWPNVFALATLVDASDNASLVDPATILLSRLSLSDEEMAFELAQLKAMAPETQCIVLGIATEPSEVLSVLGQGAKGYAAISSTFDTIVESMRRVSAGNVCIPPSLFSAKPGGSREEPHPDVGITCRERAVIRAIHAGRSNKMIAYDLNVSENTIKVHVRNIMRKLHAKNRTEVAVMAMNLTRRENGAVTAPPRKSIPTDHHAR